MKKSLRQMIVRGSRTSWAATTALTNLLSVVLTTVLVTFAMTSTSTIKQWASGLAAVIVLGLLTWLSTVVTAIRDARFPKYAPMVLEMIRVVSEANVRENEIIQNDTQSGPAILRNYLNAFQTVLGTQWSDKRFGDSTHVEVVLMNRAPDGQVTVAAWALRKPLSLARREANSEFYKDTEAAKLYHSHIDRHLRAPILLIRDISKHKDYDHFGRDISLRTNSTALFPVYDAESNFYGFVAVTARNRLDMFSNDDQDFWEESWNLWEPHFVRAIRGAGLGPKLIADAVPARPVAASTP